ncbi:ferritin-like domain-containing protein [Hymenobacter sp. HMF4947]|uniref:Ferritin-like domain-containing protein n=1 Tax=Hymenobacter ginkgonis TaxID=2682976 RepID=A0A7K1TEE5_9BACT|nr:ferritin-like domain-containing protein [Hymenobacter ginkgonis]MVN76788.1 ferritin-like domain-containing protein [Hymenobacter ginkgonis]
MNIFQLFSDLERVDPEVYGRFDSRRRVFKYLGSTGKAITAATLPTLLSGLFQKAYGQTTAITADVQAVLNLALSLEYLELYYYQAGLNANILSSSDNVAFTAIRDDERGHVNALRAVLGSAAIADPTAAAFDYTAGANRLTPFASSTNFLALAQAFEDTGVRAYKGAIPALINNKDLLTAAFNIHSVEARHSSHIRTLRRGGVTAAADAPSANTLATKPKSWISQRDNNGPLPALTASVYGAGTTTAYPAEDNTVQVGINTQSNSSSPGAGLVLTSIAATEAFDEPLDPAKVKAIALNFVASGNLKGLFV